MNTEVQQSESWWQRWAKLLFFTLLLLLPIIFLPLTPYPLTLTQQSFAMILGTLIFIIITISFTTKSEVHFPKFLTAPTLVKLPYWLVLVLFLVLVLISLLASPSHRLSFWGVDGSEADSVISLLVALLLFFVALFVLQRRTDLITVIRFVTLSSLITVIIFWLNTASMLVFKKSPVQWLGLVGGNGFSTLGNVGLFSAFVGFGFLTTLLTLIFPLSVDAAQMKKRPPVLALIALLLSFLALITIAHKPTFIALVVTLVVLLILSFIRWKKIHLLQFNIVTFFIFCFALLYFIRLPLASTFNLPVEVSLSPSASVGIVLESLKESPVKVFFGSGPVTYGQQYLKYKPIRINSTLLWNFDFRQGFSFWLSFLVTFGLLGALALMVFLLSVFFKTIGVFLKFEPIAVAAVEPENSDEIEDSTERLQENEHAKNHTEDQDLASNQPEAADSRLLFTTLVLFVYFLVLPFVYTLNFVLLAFLLAVTAMIIAATALVTGKSYHLVFTEVNSRNILVVFLLALLFVGSLALLFFGSKRYVAYAVYGQTLRALAKTGNVDQALPRLQRAYWLHPAPELARSISSLWFEKLRQRLNQASSANIGTIRSEIQRYFNNAIDAAQIAIRVNPQDYVNWSHLGGIYENLIPLVQGANTMALQNYKKVQELNPRNPIPYLQAARIEILSADNNLKPKEATLAEAEKYLREALKLKSDYLDASLLLAQVYQRTGRLAEAIRAAKAALVVNPQNIGLLFQVGYLEYITDDLAGAKQAFLNLLRLNPNYSNAKYYLGLIYDREGNKEAAIKEFNEILQLNPGNPEVIRILQNLRAGKPAL